LTTGSRLPAPSASLARKRARSADVGSPRHRRPPRPGLP